MLLKLAESSLIHRIPDDIIERIFSLLPVTHVYAISISSRRFKETWRLCPDLSFDEEFSKSVSCHNRLKVIINEIISGHSGQNVRRFKLYFNPTGNEDLVNDWISKIVTLIDIEEIYLNFSLASQPLVLHERIVFPENLRVLHLSHCNLNLPMLRPKSLPNLQVFTLEDIYISQQLTDSILISCNSLQYLKFISCFSSETIVLTTDGVERSMEIHFKDCDEELPISVMDARFLNRVRFQKMGRDIKLELGKFNFYVETYMSQGIDFGVPVLSGLATQHFMLKDLYISDDPEFHTEGYTLWNVHEFHVRVESNACINLFYIPILLHKCPDIKRVWIDLEEGSIVKRGCSEKWVRRVMDHPTRFRHLNVVVMSGMRGEDEIEQMILVEFFIMMSTCETMTVILDNKDEGHDFKFNVNDTKWMNLKKLKSESNSSILKDWFIFSTRSNFLQIVLNQHIRPFQDEYNRPFSLMIGAQFKQSHPKISLCENVFLN